MGRWKIIACEAVMCERPIQWKAEEATTITGFHAIAKPGYRARLEQVQHIARASFTRIIHTTKYQVNL